MSTHNLVIFLSILVLGSFVINYVNAEESIPDWVKNTAGWWAEDAISETEFVSAIEFLIKVNIISVEKENLPDEWEYLPVEIIPSTKEITYNKDGLRNYEIKEKGINEYRIIMVGGSTTFGAGVEDNETIPYYLENEFKKNVFKKNVKIINAGIQSAWSQTEVALINEKLLKFNPDLIIIYDGWNDLDRFVGSTNFVANPIYWEERWKQMCRDLSNEDVKTMIILQPFIGTGERVITDQEYVEYFLRKEIHQRYLEYYTMYAERLELMEENCAKVSDFRNIFDNVNTPLFWDLVHLGTEGNKLIAKEIFRQSKDIVTDTKYENEYKEKIQTKEKQFRKVIDPKSLNLDFSYVELSNYDFSNADLTNADFRFSKISNVNFQGADLSNAKFSRSILENIDFSNANLENSKFFGTKANKIIFDNSNLENSDLRAMEMSNSVFENTNLENVDFSNSIIHTSKISTEKLTNSKFNSVKILKSDLRNLDLSTTSVEGTLINNTVLAGSDLSNVNFGQARLNYVDFSQYYHNGEIMKSANLSSVDFQSNETLKNSILGKIPFSEYEDIEVSNPNYMVTDQLILEKDILPRINLITNCTYELESDLAFRCIENELKKTTKIKINYKLEDVKKYGVILANADLSGLDMRNHSVAEWVLNFSGEGYQTSNKLNNNLIGADLQGANLSNTNLENVDLSFSNLKGANLSDANLTNTNLHGVDLSKANLDGAILKCKNNPICE
ncbi:pentapeptide repeat-containing protein [Candidatus Nitrosopelagicus sp.]|nr:pentapeptide repeat-containing protein [Candidatus Nitrosopelagicus sp.]